MSSTMKKLKYYLHYFKSPLIQTYIPGHQELEFEGSV